MPSASCSFVVLNRGKLPFSLAFKGQLLQQLLQQPLLATVKTPADLGLVGAATMTRWRGLTQASLGLSVGELRNTHGETIRSIDFF